MPIARSMPNSLGGEVLRRVVLRIAQRVGDAEERDHDRQHQQRVDEVDELVDLFFAAFLQFLLVQYFGGRKADFDQLGQLRLHHRRLRPGRRLDEVGRVLGLAELFGKRGLGDQDAAEDAELGVELPDHFEARPVAGLAEQAKAITGFEVVIGGEGVREDRLVVAQAAQHRRPTFLPFNVDGLFNVAAGR